MFLKSIFVGCCLVGVASAMAQDGGPSSADSVGFTRMTMKVSDILKNTLTAFGEIITGDITQNQKGPWAKKPGYTEYVFPDYRMLWWQNGGDVYVLENTRMTKRGEPGARVKTPFKTDDEAKTYLLDAAKKIAHLNYDYGQNPQAAYTMNFSLVSAQEARKAQFNGGRPYYGLTLGKLFNGYAWLNEPEYLYLAVDQKSGDLLYYRRHSDHDHIAVDSNLAIEESQAVAAAATAYGSKAQNTKPDVQLGYVVPNTKYGAEKASDPDSGTLAYIVTYGKDQVWIHARTGVTIGGL